ncbi:porin [Colwellia sp. D2M02]|uniref:porin n=1 Tax=Colwellia sp. D2M02 TaxID=2841562 RepID=UPI001C098104|nr:porin [Colwellia sp. D2M02]MBU2894926.1 porin [Colwellia sp. D2M02]
MLHKKLFTIKKLALATSLLAVTGAANAGYTLKLDDDNSITFGGYVKVDTRYVDGNIAATDYWYGGGTVLAKDQSNFGIAANETRFNTKYVHGDVTGFIEIDFYGDAVSGGGNEVISNSSKPRLRHAFIKYKDVLVGQTWTTFQNTSSLAESADFGGPLVASAFIRQGQIRYTNGGLQLSIENPETYGVGAKRGTGLADDSVPDFIGKYTFKGDWGNVSVSALARQLQTLSGSESAFGYGIAGRINTFGKDDFRFQVHGGNVGRYVGVTASTDVGLDSSANIDVEDTTSIMVAYRHFWTEDMRSSVFYGNTQTDLTDRDRSHWGVNLFKNVTKQLSFGLEVGNFEMAESDADSNYVQLSAKFVL